MPKCACPVPDAYACLTARYNIAASELEHYEQERCECCCHLADECGLDEWDYEMRERQLVSVSEETKESQ